MELARFSFSKLQSCLSILAVILALFFSRISCAANDTDKLALLAIKAKISVDPFEKVSSWNDTVGFCHWYGVTCSRRHHRVTVLELHSQKLAGSISPYIGNLSFLRELWLYDNSFHGGIPTQIGQLRRLRVLHLGNNSLTGEIPTSISGCANLVMVGLYGNQLSGGIPVELGSLSNLQLLSMGVNYLTGSIPSSIGNLSSLEIFGVPENHLSGSIPPALAQLTKIKTLALGLNRFSGTIPPPIFNLSSMVEFDIGGNQIQGSLPGDMGFTLPNLEDLIIHDNQFYGSIPVSISNATGLWRLVTAANNLTGKVPSWRKLNKLRWLAIGSNHLGSGGYNDLNFLCTLTNATNLWLLNIEDNGFGGVLPECIGNFSTDLSNLEVDNNLIVGEIPSVVGNLVNLEAFYFHKNKFSGTLPPSIGNIRNLKQLALSYNNLSGWIPSSLGNLENLTALYLHHNKFHGHIPSNLSKCQRLLELDLSSNDLAGTIPPEVVGLSSLSVVLNLSHNHLTGVIPMEIGNLRILASLDISMNMLDGEIPNTLGSCIGLVSVRMNGNMLQGVIPQTIRSLRAIDELDLSCNNLSGEIPRFFKEFPFLNVLNLSYNNFVGSIPIEGIFKNATAFSVVGNRELCGGIPELGLRKCISNNSKRGIWHKLKLFTYIILPVVGIALALTFLYLGWMKKKTNETLAVSSGLFCPNLSYGTLLKVTNGFSSANLIGVGSFGSVYKGVLNENGLNTVAVKVLNLQHHGALRSFLAECNTLKNIRHRNLLKLLTVCSSVDYQGHDFKALVYEFMDNGNLEHWLHPNQQMHDGNRSPRRLTFTERINVAVDIAYALDYLHNQCEIPIIHCDLKPSNVLLDAEMVAHVGDFGLAKFILGLASDFVADQTSSVGIRGTIGYAAPEYAVGSQISKEGDVYGFGIMLLEMFSGVSPTNDMFKDDLNLHKFVKEALPERALEVTDPTLLDETKSHTGLQHRGQLRICERQDIAQDCLLRIYETGVSCSVMIPRERISITKAATQLRLIREKLLGIRCTCYRYREPPDNAVSELEGSYTIKIRC